MTIPLHILYRDIPKSDALDTEIRKRVDKLEHFARQIEQCRVTIGTAGKHKSQGTEYEVMIDLTLIGAQVTVGRDKPQEDVFIAVRDGFDAITRKLQDILEHRRE